MSVFYCFVCDRHIDSDYDVEHLDSCPDAGPDEEEPNNNLNSDDDETR